MTDFIVIIYNVNGINMHVDLGVCNVYADDTIVYFSSNSINKL